MLYKIQLPNVAKLSKTVDNNKFNVVKPPPVVDTLTHAHSAKLAHELKIPLNSTVFYELFEEFTTFFNKSSSILHVNENGSIIAANEYCKRHNGLTCTWAASTASPSKQLLPGVWLSGSFCDGDLSFLDNVRSIKQDATEYAVNTMICNNTPHNNIEVLAGETILALTLLPLTGNLIIRFWNFYEEIILCLLHLLSYAFTDVYATKPYSILHNTDIYIVCLNKKNNIELPLLYRCIYLQDPTAVIAVTEISEEYIAAIKGMLTDTHALPLK